MNRAGQISPARLVGVDFLALRSGRVTEIGFVRPSRRHAGRQEIGGVEIRKRRVRVGRGRFKPTPTTYGMILHDVAITGEACDEAAVAYRGSGFLIALIESYVSYCCPNQRYT